MNKDFELFQREFKKWQYRFGLTGYKVYFKHEPTDGAFADITVLQGDMVATVRLNSNNGKEQKPFMDIRRSAKHEALHLLLRRLESRGRDRYVFPAEITEAAEEIVFKLEELIV